MNSPLDDILEDIRGWEDLPSPHPGEAVAPPASPEVEASAVPGSPPGLDALRRKVDALAGAAADTPEPTAPLGLPPEPREDAPPGRTPTPETASPELPPLLSAPEGRRSQAAPPSRQSSPALPEDWGWAEPREAEEANALPAYPRHGEEAPYPEPPALLAAAPAGGPAGGPDSASEPYHSFLPPPARASEPEILPPAVLAAGRQSGGASPSASRDADGDIPDVPELDADAIELLLSGPSGGSGNGTPPLNRTAARPDAAGDELPSSAGFAASASAAGGGGRAVELLERIVQLLEKMAEGEGGYATPAGHYGGRGATAPGSVQRGRGSALEPLDLEADEGYPQASPSVSVSTVAGTGGAGGWGYGSKRPSPSSVMSGGNGRAKPGSSSRTFLDRERGGD